MSRITNAILIGRTRPNSDLSVKVFSDSNDPIRVNYVWLRSTSYDGEYQVIRGESSEVYRVRPSDVYVKCLVINESDQSNQVYTNVAVINSQSHKSQSSESVSRIDSVGSGLSYKSLISSVSGMSNTVSDIGRINQSIEIILSTAKGEVPMIPNLGCDLYLLLFEGVTDSLLDLIKMEVVSAITSQEPRVNLTDVTVDYDGNHTISVRVNYNIKNTNIKSSYIYNINTDEGRAYW